MTIQGREMSTPYEMMERIDRLEATLVRVVKERDTLRRLLVEIDDYLMHVENASMSISKTEALAAKLRVAIAAKESQ